MILDTSGLAPSLGLQGKVNELSTSGRCVRHCRSIAECQDMGYRHFTEVTYDDIILSK